MIGIIGATKEEIHVIKTNMLMKRTEMFYGICFFVGLLSDCPVVVACSGIGKVNAARCAQLLICRFTVTFIINIGIAGSLLDRLSIGDVVISETAKYFDYDASGIGVPVGKMLGMKDSIFHADNTLTELAEKSCEHILPQKTHMIGMILTGDQFVSNSEQKRNIYKLFGGICVEMEGAAIAQTAMMCDKPWVIIRAISDCSDSASAINVQKHKQTAIDNCSIIVLDLIKKISY